jgi:MATE family multidrug resistance protein
MPMGYYLTKVGINQPMGAAGMWYGMIIGLTIFSFLSLIRLKLIIKQFLRIEII